MSLLEAAAHSKPIIQSTECNFEELAKEEISWVCNTDVEDIQKNLEIALSVEDSELLDKGKARELIEKNTWDISKSFFITQINCNLKIFGKYQ